MADQDHVANLKKIREHLIDARRKQGTTAFSSDRETTSRLIGSLIETQAKIAVIDQAIADEERLAAAS